MSNTNPEPKYTTCPKCQTDAVHLATAYVDNFYGDADDNLGNPSEYADLEPPPGLHSYESPEVCLFAHICFECGYLEDVGIEFPRDKAVNTTTKSEEKELQMKPGNFTDHPFDSVLKNSESETIARNIMEILKRTGDEFRELTWDEYEQERLKDGNFSTAEHGYFDKVINYCHSEQTAILFSPTWAKMRE